MTTSDVSVAVVAGLPGYPVPLQTIEDQKHWEADQVEEGIRRYRRAIAEADLADTPAGMVAFRDMMPGLTAAIAAAQEEARVGLTRPGERGAKPAWWWLIAWVPADKLAFITVKTLMTTHLTRSYVGGVSVLTAALNIAGAVRDEIEFEAWRRAEAAAAKADPQHMDMFKWITGRGEANQRNYREWRRKLAAIERLDWTRAMKLHLGAKLIDLAVRHGGGWFELRVIARRGKTERHVLLSDLAVGALKDINARLEVGRPYLMPMICPPKAWERDG